MSILKNYIEGKTQLNKLKYGTFNVGNEPIIQKTIPSTIEEQGNKSTQGSKRADDLARIAALMTRSQGLTYLSNEAQLGRVRIKGKEQSEEGSSLLGNLLGGSVNAVRVLGSTLAQVPVNNTGIHFVKGFQANSHYLGRNYAGIVKEGGKFINTGYEVEVGANKLKSQTTPIEIAGQEAEFTYKGQVAPERMPQPNPEQKIENRVGLGNISKKISKDPKTTYSKFVIKDELDRINLLEPYKTGGPITTFEQFNAVKDSRDLAKFRFEVINSDNNGKNTVLVFRALIDSIDDSHTADWSSTNYIGRGEPFYNYIGSQRSINLSFKVAAMTRHELKPIYNKLNNLISTTSPTYNKDGFMRGTFTKLTVGSFFYEIPGFIESLDLSWNTTYPWEIAMTEPDVPDSDDDVQELPMVLDVSLSFRPVHSFRPETGNTPFLTRSDKKPFLP